MSAVDDILKSLDLDEVAGSVGASPDEVDKAVRAVVPALLGGLQANAGDPAGEASIAEALGQHADRLPDDQVSLGDIDQGEGAKIAEHVFGGTQDQVVQQLGGLPGLNSSLVSKLIPILAPIVLSYLAKRVGSGALGSGVVGTILGQLIKGAGNAPRPQGSTGVGSILTNVLGGLLGGGRR